MPRIAIDVSAESVVVTCTSCPWWSAFAWTRPQGWAAGAHHQRAAHGLHRGNAITAVSVHATRAKATTAADSARPM